MKMLSSQEVLRREAVAAIDRRIAELRANVDLGRTGSRHGSGPELVRACRFAIRELRALRREVRALLL